MPGVVSFLDLDPRLFKKHGKEIRRDLGLTDRAFTGSGKKASKLKGIVAGVFAGFSAAIVIRQLKLAAEAVGRFVGNSVILAAEQAAAFALVEQTIKSTGGAAGLAAPEIADMAKELQDLTGIGDEVILTYANMALTFTNLSKEVFPEVLERALDIAQTMGTSVRESLVQVAKATNDPIGGLGTLSRVGIQFTQDQKDMAKQLVETGDVMGAQRIILDELAKQFGGAARAARNTLPGALVAIKSVSGDLQEALGEGLRPEIRGLIEDMILGVKGSEDLATALGVTLGDQLKAIKPLIDDIGGSIQLFIRLNEGSAVSSSRWAGSLLALVPGLQALVEVLALDLKVASELAAINALLDSTIEDQEESVDNLLEGMRKLLDARRDQFKASEDQADAAEEEAEAIKEVASAYQQLQAQLLEAEGIVDLMERTGVSAADAATAVAVLLSEDNKASEEQVLALVEALNAAREAAERLSLQELLEIGARDIRTARFEPSPAFERAQELIAELEGLQEMTVTPNMEGLIVELERASQEFGKDMSDVMRRAGQLLLHFVQQAADTFTAGLGGQQQTGPLGGQSAGTFAQEGADIGNAIGGLFGPGWAVFGQVVGGILGDFIKKGADDASAELVLVAGELKARVIWAEGALTETFGPLAQAFADSIQGVLDSIGGTIQALPENFNIEFRSGQWIKVWGRIFDATEEGIQEGLAFAVIQLLTQADVSGVEPEVQQALESFVGNTLEGFEEAMALAMRLAEGRIGPEATRVRQALEQAFADIEAGVSAGIDIQGGIANIQRFRDQLLGLEQDLGAQKAAEIDAYNAAIDMEILRIQVLGLELQAMEANLQGRLGGVQELAEIVGVEADLNVQRIESMAAVAQATAGAIQAEGARVAAMAAATQVTVEMATGTAEVLARVAGVLADLEALRITGAERAAAIALAAAGRARRAGGGGQSEADRLAEAREREAEAIRETNLEIIRAASFGSQYHEQLANINRDFEAQLEILGPLTLDHEDYANALRAQGILVEQLTDDAYASLGSRTLSLMDEMEQFGETLAFLAKQGIKAIDTVDKLGIAIRDKVVSVLGGALSFLESAVEGIEDPAERLAAQEAIARLQAEFWGIEFRFMELELQLLFQEIEAAGLLNEQTAAWFETVFGLFDTLGENLGDVIDSMADIPGQISDAADALAAAADFIIPFPELLPAGLAGGVPNIPALLAAIAELQNPSVGLSAPELLLLQVQQWEPFLAAFGVTIEDLTAQLTELIEAADADQLAAGMQNLQDILDSIVAGPLSFLSPNAQATAQLAEITSLFATAGGSDTAAAAAAVAALGQILPGFLGPGGLGAQGFGAAFGGIQDIIQAQLEALGLTPSSFGDGAVAADPFGSGQIVVGIDTTNTILQQLLDEFRGGNRHQVEFDLSAEERMDAMIAETAEINVNMKGIREAGPKT